MQSKVHHHVALFLFVLLCGSSWAAAGHKIELKYLLFPDDVIIEAERDFTLCAVNVGEENEIDPDEGDAITLTIPVGMGNGDLATDDGIGDLACGDIPVGWSCEVDLSSSDEAVVTFEPAGAAITVAPEALFCFGLEGIVVSSEPGLVFNGIDHDIKQADNLRNDDKVLTTFKSAEGTVAHDDLADVRPDQHHAETWETVGDETVALNEGNVVVPGLEVGEGALLLDDLLQLRSSADAVTVVLDADSADAGRLTLRDAAGQTTARLSASGGLGGGALGLFNSAGARTLALDGDDDGNAPELRMHDVAGNETVKIDARDGSGGGGLVRLLNSAGTLTAKLDADESDDAVLRLSNATGTETIHLDASNSGRIGLGTASPTVPLEIVKPYFARVVMKATSPTEDVVMFMDARGDGSDRGQLGTLSDHGLTFFINSSPRMIMKANGDVCIGDC